MSAPGLQTVFARARQIAVEGLRPTGDAVQACAAILRICTLVEAEAGRKLQKKMGVARIGKSGVIPESLEDSRRYASFGRNPGGFDSVRKERWLQGNSQRREVK